MAFIALWFIKCAASDELSPKLNAARERHVLRWVNGKNPKQDSFYGCVRDGREKSAGNCESYDFFSPRSRIFRPNLYQGAYSGRLEQHYASIVWLLQNHSMYPT
jgi:hypothetical protein